MRPREIFKNKLLKNALIIVSGSGTAQAITLLASPIITRLYDPKEFGALGSFMALAAVLLPLATMSLSMAVVLPRRKSTAISLIHFSLFHCLLSSLLLLGLWSIDHQILLKYFSLDSLEYIQFLFPLYLLSTGAVEVFSFWMVRNKNFMLRAKVVFFQSLLSNSLKILVGLFAGFQSSLIVITLFTSLVTGLLYLYFFRNSLFSKNYAFKKSSHTRAIYSKYIDFLRFRTPQRLLVGLNQSLPILLMTYYFDLASAGFFTLCRTVLMMPLSLIATSLSDVLYPDIKERINEGRPVSNLILKSTLALSLLSFLPFSFIFFYGKELFSFVFGDGWAQAGLYSEWFVIWIFFNFINRPSVAAVSFFKFEKSLLLNSSLNSVLIVFAFYFASTIGNDITAIAMYSIVCVIPQIIIMFGVYNRSKKILQFR